MGLDFSKTAQQSVVTTPPAAKNEIEVVESYDIVADRQEMNTRLVDSPKVVRLSAPLRLTT